MTGKGRALTPLEKHKRVWPVYELLPYLTKRSEKPEGRGGLQCPLAIHNTMKLMKSTHKVGANPITIGVPMEQQILDVREGEQPQNAANKIKTVEVPLEGSLLQIHVAIQTSKIPSSIAMATNGVQGWTMGQPWSPPTPLFLQRIKIPQH